MGFKIVKFLHTIHVGLKQYMKIY